MVKDTTDRFANLGNYYDNGGTVGSVPMVSIYSF